MAKKDKEKRKIKNIDLNKEKRKRLISFKKLLLIIFILIVLLAIKTAFDVLRWQNIATSMISNTNSKVIDSEGNTVEEIGSYRNTQNAKFADIPENLVNAYISIEDQRFYSHHGVDLPRTGAAILSYIKNMGSSSFGGSSITQQLVKNLTGDRSSTITRKMKEWVYAFSLEMVLSKEEILEGYLNIIYTGPNIYGVSLGSKYYFNKNISELDLAECAFLAGINNSPNSYNPFGEKDTSEKIKTRTKAVLDKMLELGYITQEDHDTATEKVEKGFKFKQGKISKEEKTRNYTYFVDTLLTEVKSDLEDKYGMNDEFAENYLNMAGLRINSSLDSKIQKVMDQEVSKKKYSLKSGLKPNTYSQVAMVMIDNETGKVVGIVGGTGKKEAGGFNRATQALRQTGSSGKPIAVLVPAIDKKIITAATILDDSLTTFDDGTEEGYTPTDYNKPKGKITLRQAVESSQNIPFVKIMEMITPKTSISYMKKMGITTLTDLDDNLNLALGGLDKGISPLEMAVAYETIANDGQYIEPSFYNSVTSINGKIIVSAKQVKKRIYSKETAYIVKSLLKEPVEGSSGTAKYCFIQGMDICAKTGTTNNDYDRWLCGFSPYYTAATWFGFDYNETINFNNKNPSGQIWSSVMKQVHSSLDKKSFTRPTNVIHYQICKSTGLLSTTNCKDTQFEYFIAGTEPQEMCTEHPGELKQNVDVDYGTDKTDKTPVKEETTVIPTETPTQIPEQQQPETPTETPTQPEQTIPADTPEETQPSTDNNQDNTENTTPSTEIPEFIDTDDDSDTGFSDDEFEQ